MNQKQRTMTLGHLVDRLQDLADTLSDSLPGLSVLERAAIWVEIEGLVAAEKKIEWAARRVEKGNVGLAR